MNTKFYGLAKANRNSYFKKIGAGKYQTGGTSQQALTAEEANALVRQKQAEKEAYKKMLEEQAKIAEIKEGLVEFNAKMNSEYWGENVIDTQEAQNRKNRLSKVCVIANNLIKQGLTRSAAFKKAWSIVKSEIIETKAVGVSFGRRQEALERLTHYETDNITIELKREVENEFDNNAVQIIATVKGKGSYPVGYIPKTLSVIIAPLIDYGKQIKALFKEIRGKYKSYYKYGLAVELII